MCAPVQRAASSSRASSRATRTRRGHEPKTAVRGIHDGRGHGNDPERGLTRVDTNILIDIASGSAQWADWSRKSLAAARRRGPLLTNVAVYAEFAIGFATQPNATSNSRSLT